MALLPDGINIGADTEVIYEDYPTYTFYVDPLTKQIRGMTDGLQAMVQAVEIILSIERFVYQIYTPNSGVEFEGLIGEPYGFVISELRRRIEDSFVPDTRIIEATDFRFEAHPLEGVLVVNFTVITVFGNFPYELDVPLEEADANG